MADCGIGLDNCCPSPVGESGTIRSSKIPGVASGFVFSGEGNDAAWAVPSKLGMRERDVTGGFGAGGVGPPICCFIHVCPWLSLCRMVPRSPTAQTRPVPGSAKTSFKFAMMVGSRLNALTSRGCHHQLLLSGLTTSNGFARGDWLCAITVLTRKIAMAARAISCD